MTDTTGPDDRARDLLTVFLDAAAGRSLRHAERETVLLRCSVPRRDGMPETSDEVADEVDRRLRRLVRRGDVCVRLLDRTWVVVAETRGAAEAGVLTDRLRTSLTAPCVSARGEPVRPVVHMVVHLADPTRPAEDLLVDLLRDSPAPVPPRPRRPVERAPWVLRAAAGPGAPAVLRHGVRQALQRHRQTVSDAAELAVSELTTELLHHRAADVLVRLEPRSDGELRLDVQAASAMPDGWAARPGRGLDLVRRFAERVGHYTGPDGTTHLWCDLAARA